MTGRDVGAIVQIWQEHPTPTAAGGSDDPLLTIGVFARRSRLSMKALRLYDRLGLLPPADVDPTTGYRRYRESQLATARLVAMLRRLDLPLSEVAMIVSAPGAQGAELLASYWESVERRIASQRELAAHLRVRLSGGDAVSEMYGDVRRRQAPGRLVLTERRHVRVDALAAWLGTAMYRLAASAREFGGMVAPQFVVFHGEVNQDGDGPVEICTPIDPAREGSVEMPTRPEPAHEEAYVRLRKAQVAYPQILSAYDAVAQWIHASGLAIAGPPREIYFADWDTAGPADEVCDVAFPVR